MFNISASVRIALWLVIALMAMMVGCGGSGQVKDQRSTVPYQKVKVDEAGELFRDELAFLDSVVTGQFDGSSGTYPLDRIQKSITFMERLTRIASVADGTYIGRIAPTKHDVERWKGWFEVNKDCLFLGPDSCSITLDTICQSRQLLE
jgi:hypothetical protein